jgi:hypothetical protein
MLTWLLRQFGFLKVDWGFACGRHWICIDGNLFYEGTVHRSQSFDESVSFIIAGISRKPAQPQERKEEGR